MEAHMHAPDPITTLRHARAYLAQSVRVHTEALAIAHAMRILGDAEYAVSLDMEAHMHTAALSHTTDLVTAHAAFHLATAEWASLSYRQKAALLNDVADIIATEQLGPTRAVTTLLARIAPAPLERYANTLLAQASRDAVTC